MRTPLLALALAVSATAARADDNRSWTRADTAWQLAFTTALVVDWGQTLDDGNRESNPILGAHPSRESVHLYMASVAVGHAVVSFVLPKPYRRYWQALTIGIEGHAAWRNWRAGVTINF